MHSIKKIFTFIIIILISFVNIQAQKVVTKPKKGKSDNFGKVNITYYPFASISSSMMTGLEFDLKNGNSFKINGAIGYNQGNSWYYDKFYNRNTNSEDGINISNVSSYNFDFQYRINLGFRDKVEGNYYYVSPTFHFKNIQFDYIDNSVSNPLIGKENVTAYGIGLNLGYRYISTSRFVFDVYIGGGLQQNSRNSVIIPKPSGVVDTYQRGVFFAPGVSLGIRI